MNCTCGCDQPIPDKHLFRYRPPFLLRGHRPTSTPLCACGCDQPVKFTPYQRARFMKGHDKRLPVPAPKSCACGCGEATTIRKGKNLTYITGHNRRGLPRPDRGDGRMLNPFGYVLVYEPRHPYAKPGMKGYVLEHRLVMEEHLGRPLARWEHVHHLNGDKLDNRRENLEVVPMREHGRRHGWPAGRPATPEHRANLSAAMRQWWAERKAHEA